MRVSADLCCTGWCTGFGGDDRRQFLILGHSEGMPLGDDVRVSQPDAYHKPGAIFCFAVVSAPPGASSESDTRSFEFSCSTAPSDASIGLFAFA